ncbi:MAG: hypothetical protein KW802_01435 [Candidatus Doudnabacteria bacterium]|nr:hypothetical protein [Candidatus Doudnabacteria bacterium]
MRRKKDHKPGIILLVILAAAFAVFFTLAKRHPATPGKSSENIVPTPLPPTPMAQPLDLTGKQVIVFAFDGSKAQDMWQESLDFAQQMKEEGKPIHFTYFISGVYLLTYKNKTLYQPPLAPAGSSLIGYGDSKADVIRRINQINRAVAEGHEIGSHLNGHFSGTNWTTQDWEQEFDQFEKLFTNVNANNQIDPNVAKLNLSLSDIVGFRAPDLGRNPSMLPVVKAHGFVYDTSATGKRGEWPLIENGIWEFPVASIRYANTTSSLLSMDYNFYIHQTNGRDLLKQGTDGWQKALDDVYISYVNYFNSNYDSTKAPVLIAHHFSKWNDGVYWEAMKKFAAAECGKPDVRCVSYKELVNYLNSQLPE